MSSNSDSGDFSSGSGDDYIPDQKVPADEPVAGTSAAVTRKLRKSDLAEGKLKAEVVRSWVDQKLLVPDIPKSRGRHWKNGIRCLYWSDTKEQLKHWFYCSVCGWTNFVILSGGTAPLASHAASHDNLKLTMDREEVARILNRATNNTVPIAFFLENLPKNGKW